MRALRIAVFVAVVAIYPSAGFSISNWDAINWDSGNWATSELLDTDNDGLTDIEETEIYGTNPNLPDSDGDTLSDGDEVLIYGTNPSEPDTDLDGLNDGIEILSHQTNPLNADTDFDGLTDQFELNTLNTDPKNETNNTQLIQALVSLGEQIVRKVSIVPLPALVMFGVTVCVVALRKQFKEP